MIDFTICFTKEGFSEFGLLILRTLFICFYNPDLGFTFSEGFYGFCLPIYNDSFGNNCYIYLSYFDLKGYNLPAVGYLHLK